MRRAFFVDKSRDSGVDFGAVKKLLALLIAVPVIASAQEAANTIKVTTKLRPDGSTASRIVDPDKHTIEESIKDQSGRILSKTVFTTDERGISVGATHFDAKGNVRYKEVYQLDLGDRIASSSLLSATGQPLGKRVFNYDSKGNARVEDYDASGNLISRPTAANQSRGRPDKPTIRRAIPVR